MYGWLFGRVRFRLVRVCEVGCLGGVELKSAGILCMADYLGGFVSESVRIFILLIVLEGLYLLEPVKI